MRDLSPSCPERDFPNAPIRTHRQTVRPEWIDYNGHMNVAYYTMAFDIGFDDLIENWIGTGESFVARSRLGPMTLQQQVCYLSELVEGEGFHVDTRLVDCDHKRMHVFAEMVSDSGVLAATMESLGVIVDLDTRKTTEYPDWAVARMERLKAAQAGLPRPKQLGQTIGIRRKS
jgi:acyl-CoA thioester hydrolase